MWNYGIIAEGKIKRTGGAPAAGCFGQFHANVNHRAAEREQTAEAASAWARLADRFAAIDYGDGQSAAKKAPRTS